jgi:flagellar protein FliS
MVMNANTATKTYASVGIETGALAADPHKLISMLYQGALLAIAKARNGMMRIDNAKNNKKDIKSKDVAAKCAAIINAMAIIDDGLNASLNKKVGGELAQNLSSLYDYMVIRLTQANLNNDMAVLDEVTRLLNELKSAWDSIRNTNKMSDAAAPPEAVKAPSVYAVPAAAPQSPTKSAPTVVAMRAPQPKAVAAAPMVTPQQRVANKVQALYGRV